jgi:Rrf2 family protein
VRLGRDGEDASLTIGELSRREGISAANVAKIMRVLRRAGFVTSTRGQAGGYTLSRPPEEISVGEVLAALGGRIYDARFCERHAGAVSLCTSLPDCSLRPVWRQLQDVMDQVLGRLTLKSLLCSENEIRVPVSPRAVSLPLTVVEG